MKKTLLLFFVLYSITFSAQTLLFNDDFSDGDASDWTFYDVDGNPDNDWFLASESVWDTPFGYYNDFFLASYSWNGDDYTPDNIAVSPPVNIPAGATNVELSFISGSGNDEAYFSEHYAVYVTTTNDQASILASTPVFEETLQLVGFSVKTVDISSYAGSQVYISFRHFNTTGEWVLVVDEVQVTADTSAAVIDNEITDFKYFAKDKNLNISASSNFASISIYDMTGKKVLNQNLNASKESISLNVTDGIYIAKVTTEDNKVKTFKFIVR